MRTYSPDTLTYLQESAGVAALVLIWIKARNRTTGADEYMGLSTGADAERVITIDGQVRTYYGAGNVLEVAPLTMQTGLSVRMRRVVLANLTPEIIQLIRGYSVRFAPIEIHRVFFHPDTDAPIPAPHMVFRGFVDELALPTPAVGGAASCEMTIATSARALTATLPLKKSDATQQLRAGDRMRRFVDVSGAVPVWWGEARSGT